MDIDKLRYPVGPMPRTKTPLDRATREQHLATIEQLPSRIKSLVAGLSDAQLDTPYRLGGGTVRQARPHLPGRRPHACGRMKIRGTAGTPAAQTYEKKLWGDLADAKPGPAPRVI